MSLNIKSATAERAIRKLAAATGESLTQTIEKAAEERLARVQKSRGRGKRKSLAERLGPFQEMVAAEREGKKGGGTAKELMDALYDDHGAPI